MPNTYIALFRGINIGGRHLLPMKNLVNLLADLGCAQVRTYIQSGNAVFRHPTADHKQLARQISQSIAEKYGFAPGVLLLTAAELQAVVVGSPFVPRHGKDLHCFFLEASPVAPDMERLAALRAPSEAFKLGGTFFYLHAPHGVGRSRLAFKVEQCLGVTATARNWNTVLKLLQMARMG